MIFQKNVSSKYLEVPANLAEKAVIEPRLRHVCNNVAQQ